MNGGLVTSVTPVNRAHITATLNTPHGSRRKRKDNRITRTGELKIIVVASPIGSKRKLK